MIKGFCTITFACILAGMLGLGFALADMHGKLNTFGKDVPMDSLIQLFELNGYSLNFGEGVDINATLSWDTGDDWKSIFQNALAERNMKAVFDDRTISIVMIPEVPDETNCKTEEESCNSPVSGNSTSKLNIQRNALEQVSPVKLIGTEAKEKPANVGKSAGTLGQSAGLVPLSLNGFKLIPRKPEKVRADAVGEASATGTAAKGGTADSKPSASQPELRVEDLILPKPKPAFWQQMGDVTESNPKANLKNSGENDADVNSKTEGNGQEAQRSVEVADAGTENSPAEKHHDGIGPDKATKESTRVGRAYIAEVDRTLRQTLRKWTEMESWTLIWESEYDYIIQAEATFGGDLITAVTQIVLALQTANPLINVEFFSGNKVVHITSNAGDNFK